MGGGSDRRATARKHTRAKARDAAGERRADKPATGGATKAGLIAEALRETIASGSLEDNARLYQDELAKQFETSITPVREALKMLQAEGLLVSEPHRGVRVAFPDLDEIASIYVMRRLVEPYAARRSARRLSRLQLDRARRINDQFGAVDSVQDARRLNREFHFIFYEACGLPTLLSEIERLWTGFPWAALQVHRVGNSASYEEHLSMLEMISDVDEAAIQSAFEVHILHGFEALVAHMGVTLAADPFEGNDDRGADLKEDGWWTT